MPRSFKTWNSFSYSHLCHVVSGSHSKNSRGAFSKRDPAEKITSKSNPSTSDLIRAGQLRRGSPGVDDRLSSRSVRNAGAEDECSTVRVPFFPIKLPDTFF